MPCAPVVSRAQRGATVVSCKLAIELLSCARQMMQARRSRSSGGSAGPSAAAASPGVPASMCLQPRGSHAEPPQLRPVRRTDSGGSACSRGSMDSGSSDATCLGPPSAADMVTPAKMGPAAQPRLCSLAALLDACGRCFLPSRAARGLVATVAVRWHPLEGSVHVSLVFHLLQRCLCHNCSLHGFCSSCCRWRACCPGVCPCSPVVRVATLILHPDWLI